MRRKLAFLLVAALAATSLLAGCGKKEADNTAPSTKDEKAEEGDSKESTTFTVGFDASFPPYGYEENGEYIGFDLDLAQEVCERNNWTLEKQPIEWNSKDMELDAGTIDCIWNGFTMNGREKKYEWSEPYVDNSQVVIVKKDSGIKKLTDLKGKEVLAQADSSALKVLQGDQKELAATFNLTEIPEYNTAFMNLEAGAADAVAMDVGVAKFQMEGREAEFMILEESLATEQYGVGFKLGNKELRDAVQNTLNEMVADGKFAEIAEKWELTDSICLGK